MPLHLNIEDLLSARTVESDRIEFKEGWNPDAVYRSICAFANDFDNIGGGYILIGVAENPVTKTAMRPVKGLSTKQIGAIQQEMIGFNNLIKPYYAPRLFVEAVDGQQIIVLWINGGGERPYEVPETITAKHKIWKYFIRKYANSIEAKGRHHYVQLWRSRPVHQTRRFRFRPGYPLAQPLGVTASENGYAHDGNGNLTLAGPVLQAQYNIMNLPTSIRTSAGKRHFAYVDGGGKYEARIEADTALSETRHYLGGIEFVDGNPESYNFGDGRIVYSDSVPPRPQFRLHDHLGNTVVFFEDKNLDGCITTEADTSGLALEILQRLWYYPFGMAMEGLSTWDTEPGQWYRYNGKERDTLSGWTDFGARWGILEIGRWNGVDPLAGSYYGWSPFSSMLNNPISFTDPDGRSVDGEYERDRSGKWVKVSEAGDEIGVDFYHDDIIDMSGSAQITRIVDSEGNENYMTNGRKWLKGVQTRDESVNWSQLYSEWRNGNGPESSLFTGNHPANKAVQESNWLEKQIQKFNSSGKDRDMVPFNWDSGVLATLQGNNPNMHLVFMGSYNASFYKLGSRTLVFIIDDKTRESGLGHLPVKNYSRSEGMPYPTPWSETRSTQMTTTYQRHLFFVAGGGNRIRP